MKKLHRACILLATALASTSALATTYYVSNAGNDAAAGTSTSAPWRTVAKVNSMSLGSGDRVLFNSGNTWREMLQPKGSGLYFGSYGSGALPVISGANVLSSGWTQAGSNVWVYALGGYEPTEVWFQGALGHHVTSTAALVGPGEWIYSGGRLYVYSTATPNLASVPANPPAGTGVEVTQRDRALLVQNLGDITVENLAFLQATYTSIYQAANVTGYQHYNQLLWGGAPYEGFRVDSGSPQITNSAGLYSGTGIGVGGGGGMTLTNSVLSGNFDDAIEVYGTTGQSLIESSTITGNSTSSATLETISNWSDQPMKVSNSILLPNPFDPLNHSYTGITDDGTNVFTSPMFAGRAAPLIIVPYIDDYINLGVAEDVAATALQYGCHLSYALNTKLVTQADWTRVNNLVSAGHEIVAHTRSHSDLANNNVFQIQYKGSAATAMMTINTSGDVLQTFLNGSTTPDLNISLLDSYNSTQILCSSVAANPNYTCTVQPNQLYFTPLVLADVSRVSITTPYMAQASADYLTWEIEGSQADIQAHVPGYTVKSFATPFTSSSTVVEDHIKNAGFLANRNGVFTPSGASNGNWLLSQLDIYNLAAEWLPNGYDATKPASSLGAAIEGLGAAGGILGVYSHGYDEFTLAQWKTLFATLQSMGGTCMTMSQATTYIQSHGTLLKDGTGKNWGELLVTIPNLANTSASPSQGAHGLP